MTGRRVVSPSIRFGDILPADLVLKGGFYQSVRRLERRTMSIFYKWYHRFLKDVSVPAEQEEYFMSMIQNCKEVKQETESLRDYRIIVSRIKRMCGKYERDWSTACMTCVSGQHGTRMLRSGCPSCTLFDCVIVPEKGDPYVQKEN